MASELIKHVTDASFESDVLRIEGYVKNLFNNDAYPSISTTLDRFANLVRTPMASLPDKRRWGVRTKYSF